MNCANVLSTKLSKKWILLQFKSLKLKNYLYLFVMEDPVFTPPIVVLQNNIFGNNFLKIRIMKKLTDFRNFFIFLDAIFYYGIFL